MALGDLNDWMSEVSAPEYVWLVKRLAANDTLATGSHQAGIYVSKSIAFSIFPSIKSPEEKDPKHFFTAHIDSHDEEKEVRAAWYNSKPRGCGTRNECRITQWGGKKSPILNPDSTGSLVVLAFPLTPNVSPSDSRVWVCETAYEEEVIEAETGIVEPGGGFLHYPAVAFHSIPLDLGISSSKGKSCWLDAREIPAAWLKQFPAGAEIISKAMELSGISNKDADARLINRRDCEYQLFRSVEEAYFSPRINEGFKTVQDFVDLAQSILQSRKSRSGKSLELHMMTLLFEEGFIEDKNFSWNKVSEGKKRPDFIFPSIHSYQDKLFPEEKLEMLAVKTTCKDRWRQILNEADRIGRKHLLTVQEGVSENQFLEMQESGVVLVVPEKLKKKYPKDIRPSLMSVSQFILKVRNLTIAG